MHNPGSLNLFPPTIPSPWRYHVAEAAPIRFSRTMGRHPVGGPKERGARCGTVRAGNEAGGDAAALECRDLKEWISGGRRARAPGGKSPQGIGPMRGLALQ